MTTEHKTLVEELGLLAQAFRTRRTIFSDREEYLRIAEKLEEAAIALSSRQDQPHSPAPVPEGDIERVALAIRDVQEKHRAPGDRSGWPAYLCEAQAAITAMRRAAETGGTEKFDESKLAALKEEPNSLWQEAKAIEASVPPAPSDSAQEGEGK